MSGGRVNPGDEPGRDGDVDDAGSGLPPKAPAYDLRTGERLDAPRAGASPQQDDGDYSTSELGIWAPNRHDPAGGGDAGERGYGPSGQPYQPPYPPGSYQPSSYQPTPPPPTYSSTPAPPTQVPSQYPGTPTGWGSGPTLAGGGPPPNRRGTAVLAGVVGALVVAVAVLVAVLLVGRSSSGNGPAASTGPTASTGGTTNPSPTTASKGPSGGTDTASRTAFVRTVDGILTQSSSGRQQVSSVVTGVVNGCSVSPSTASATIRQVIVNRQSVLMQANALSVVDASTDRVKSELIRALNAAIEANQGYQRWLDNLYSTYYNSDPVGCPDGQAPTDSNYDAATAASGRATAAKQAFVGDYNPLAAASGLRTWSESEF
jgi:hypothetical protein